MQKDFPLIALRRAEKIAPLSLEDYESTNGFVALKKALRESPVSVQEQIKKSGLRGRGGAGFPTGTKQHFTSSSSSDSHTKYVVCNADEGEPGTFKDKKIMETDPFALIEGMLIAAYAIGSNYGFVYIRGEYYSSIQNIQNAIDIAYKKNYLGKNILGTGFNFEMSIFLGAGSYLCGEELTLLESLEGKRGYPRIKPPFPAEKGLWGKPTLVNNVETFVHIPFIIEHGSERYARIGTKESKGTKLFCVSGPVKKTGVFELPMGITLKELIENVCGGMKNDKIFKGALIGGAAGTFVDSSFWDTPLAFETLKEKGATLGSGAVIVIDEDSCLYTLMASILSFFKHESCGKCVPCRVGCKILHDTCTRQSINEESLMFMQNQATYMAQTSLCPLGQSPVLPLTTFIKFFKNSL